MYPYVNILGRQFSSYGLLALVGLFAIVLYSYIIHKVSGDKKDFYDRIIYIVYCGLFGFLNAAVLYQLTNIQYTVRLLPYLFTDFEKFKSGIAFGIVFYGGLIGIFIGAMVYSLYFKEDTRDWIRTSVTVIPLFHAFGRIGCTVGGCCYGIVSTHSGVYNNETGLFDIAGGPIFCDHCVYNARIGAYCIPVQLIEATGLFLIFIILLLNQTLWQKDKEAYYRPIGIYFVSYGILRFILEFWRGDPIRGIYGPFSTSQYISMLIVPFGIYCLICPPRKNILEKWYNGLIYKKTDN